MRRVLITGGGSGIGQAVARDFADAGDAVTIAGRRQSSLEETAAGRDMICKSVDVTDESAVEALFETPFDVVVANAGSGTAAGLRNTSLETWNDTLSVTLTGVFLTFRAALGGMTTGGRLIAVASTASLQGGAKIAAYAAAKHGVLGLVRSVAKEVAKNGITCNAVCPGFVDTPLTDRSAASLSERLGIDDQAARAMLAANNPVGRLITPQEVSAAVLYLASEQAAMVNGLALTVSGGEL